MSSNLNLFGIVYGGVANGTINPSEFVDTFYCSVPVSHAKLIVDTMSFDSVYAGLETIEGFELCKLVFFNNNLKFGNLDVFSIIASEAVNGSVILYTTID